MTEPSTQRHHLADVRTAVYRFYDADDQLLYLGISHNLEERWATHERIQPWWLDVVRREFVWYDTRAEAESVETTATAVEKPRYDRSGQRTAGGEVDERLDAEMERAVQAVTADIDSGTYPLWRILPSYGALSRKYQIPVIGVTRGLAWLANRQQRLVYHQDQFAVTRPGHVPSRDARRLGLLYFLASSAFGDSVFTRTDLAERTGAAPGTVYQHLKRWEQARRVERLAKVPGQRAAAYRISQHPEPDPPERKKWWSAREVTELADWVASQLDCDEAAASGDGVTVAQIVRDRRIVAACRPVFHQLPNGSSYVEGSAPWGAPALVEMAYDYANRDGYQVDWLPSWVDIRSWQKK